MQYTIPQFSRIGVIEDVAQITDALWFLSPYVSSHAPELDPAIVHIGFEEQSAVFDRLSSEIAKLSEVETFEQVTWDELALAITTHSYRGDWSGSSDQERSLNGFE